MTTFEGQGELQDLPKQFAAGSFIGGLVSTCKYVNNEKTDILTCKSAS